MRGQDMKRKLGEEEASSHLTTTTVKTRRLTNLRAKQWRDAQEEDDVPGTSSSDSEKSPQKMMELVSLVERKVVTESKRTSRKQKRVQLKQLIVCQGGGKGKRTGGHAVAKQKTKRKSMELLMNATDHIWGPAESVPEEEPDDEWRQINLEAVNPLELIGRSCKVFWPLDQSWYVGCIREYNAVSKKHRVDYVDDQVEWLALVKEQVQFHMSVEEERALSSHSTGTSVKPGVDVDELVLLSHELNNGEERIGHGTVVWGKVKGWPVWPAIVLDDEVASKVGVGARRKSSVVVHFFGSCDFARLNNDKVVTFAKGVERKYHVKCKRPAFDQGLKEVERYLKRGRLPEKMAQTLEIQSRNKNEAMLDLEVDTMQVDKVDVPPGYKSIDLQWKHSDRCNVCYQVEEYENDLLLQCAKCRMMVHMGCYGEVESPADSIWLCQLCRQKIAPVCCLCPVSGGAMKRTTDGRWAHLTCAIWIPETAVSDVKTMEPIAGVNSINKERWKLHCSVCQIPYGACIQCTCQHCATAFHPLCARAAGFRMEVLEDGNDADGSLRFASFCAKHNQNGKREKNKNLLVTAPETPEQDIESGVHLSGCARSRPYETSRRVNQAVPYITKSSWRLVKEGDVYRSLPPCTGTNELLTISARVHTMRCSLRHRLAFGKSGIHGWGVFTKLPHQAGDMMVEYAGEIIRPIIADIREQRHYNSLVGAGTYMFKVDEQHFVDATRAGSIAHLINHSCDPNCYSRIITVNGQHLIIIFAKRRLKAGEELTYDYRFASKGEELVCNCGARNCRGSLRQGDENDGNNSRIMAPCSEISKWPCK